MRFWKNSAAAALAVALGLVGASASHAAIMQVSFTGFVFSSYDQTGIFGAPGQTLNGDAFTLKLFVDDAAPGAVTFDDPTTSYIVGSDLADPTTALLTINGTTVEFSRGNIGQAFLQANPFDPSGVVSFADYIANPIDTISCDDNFNCGERYKYLEAHITSKKHNFLAPADFRRPFHYDVAADDVAFVNFVDAFYADAPVDGAEPYENYGALQITSVTAGPASVPEPSQWALMVLGFGGLGAALRRTPSRQPI